jgi:putrescine---pyruvate transaminase
MSGLWNVNVGYGRRELIDAATRQLETLPFYNSFFQCTTEPTIALAERLAVAHRQPAVPRFFTGSGLRGQRHPDPAGAPLLAAHGAAAEEGHHQPHQRLSRQHHRCRQPWRHETHARAGRLPIPDIVHVDQPYHFEAGTNATPEAFGVEVAQRLEAKIRPSVRTTWPPSSASRCRVPAGSSSRRRRYWPEVQRICRKHDILLIADEVITGFGRLGQWFGHRAHGFRARPADLRQGRNLRLHPLGGVLVGERVSRRAAPAAASSPTATPTPAIRWPAPWRWRIIDVIDRGPGGSGT